MWALWGVRALTRSPDSWCLQGWWGGNVGSEVIGDIPCLHVSLQVVRLCVALEE